MRRPRLNPDALLLGFTLVVVSALLLSLALGLLKGYGR